MNKLVNKKTMLQTMFKKTQYAIFNINHTKEVTKSRYRKMPCCNISNQRDPNLVEAWLNPSMEVEGKALRNLTHPDNEAEAHLGYGEESVCRVVATQMFFDVHPYYLAEMIQFLLMFFRNGLRYDILPSLCLVAKSGNEHDDTRLLQQNVVFIFFSCMLFFPKNWCC